MAVGKFATDIEHSYRTPTSLLVAITFAAEQFGKMLVGPQKSLHHIRVELLTVLVLGLILEDVYMDSVGDYYRGGPGPGPGPQGIPNLMEIPPFPGGPMGPPGKFFSRAFN